MKKLSILIPTIEGREKWLTRILERLEPQRTGDVEILVNKDGRQKSIGEKRNELLEQSESDYVAFVDDDDLVSLDYVSRIVSAVETRPDCVGMEGIITFDGKRPQKFIHSLRYTSWYEKDGVFYRNPNHLSPVKRELALQVKFPYINNGEDHDYSKRLLPLLKTEVYLDNPIYFYEFRSRK